MKVVVGLLACFGVASGQLRPRRVGTNAMGEQEATLTDVPTGGGDAMGAFGGAGGADPMAAMQQMLQGMGGEGGLDIMEMMKNNPMVQQMAQGNPEMMEMMNNPEKLAEQMQQVQELMGSAEGQGMMANMMKEMQNVMTDPDKLKAGLEQLATNPALKGFADAIPGMKEMLEDPDMLAEQASKVAEVMQSMGDPEKMKELLGADGENVRARAPARTPPHARPPTHANARARFRAMRPLSSVAPSLRPQTVAEDQCGGARVRR